MSGGCRISNVIAGPLLAAVGALTGVMAQAPRSRAPSTIVVYGAGLAGRYHDAFNPFGTSDGPRDPGARMR